jgi:hypothetical protein
LILPLYFDRLMSIYNVGTRQNDGGRDEKSAPKKPPVVPELYSTRPSDCRNSSARHHSFVVHSIATVIVASPELSAKMFTSSPDLTASFIPNSILTF